MNAEETLPKRKGIPWMGVIVTLCVIVPLVELLFPGCAFGVQTPPEAIAGSDALSIRVTVERYIEEFGKPPAGDHVQVIAALRGKNPRQIDFLQRDDIRFSKRGELRDPWKHPYRIDVSKPKAVRVYSFGKNGMDEGGAAGSDDVASWR